MPRVLFSLCMCLAVASGLSACLSPRPSPPSPVKDLKFRTDSVHALRDNSKLFIQAAVRSTTHDYEGALKILWKISPGFDDAAVHFLFAKCFQALARVDSALRHIDIACTLNPEIEEHWIVAAELALSQGRFKHAAQYYSRAYDIRPNFLTKFLLAKCLEHVDELHAIELLKDLQQNTGDIATLFELATLYEKRGMTEEYLRVMEQIVSEFPAKSLPFVDYFQALLDNKRYDQALDLLENRKSNYGAENRIDNIMRFGVNAYQDSSMRNVKAIGRFSALVDQALESNADMMELCAMLWERTGDSLQARPYMFRAVTLDTSIGVSIRVSSMLVQQKRYHYAKELLVARTSLAPNNSQLNFYVGVICSLLESDSLALHYLKKAIELDSNLKEAWFQLAFVYDRVKMPMKADDAYERTLRLDPYNINALNNLAYSYALQDKKLDIALKYASAVMQQDSVTPSYLDTYGWILHKIGDYSRAAYYLERAVHAQNTSATLFEHLGDNYAKLDQRDRAVEAWKRAFELDNSKTYLRQRLLNSK